MYNLIKKYIKMSISELVYLFCETKILRLFGWESGLEWMNLKRKFGCLDEEINDEKRRKSLWVMW